MMVKACIKHALLRIEFWLLLKIAYTNIVCIDDFTIIFTKADKLGSGKARDNAKRWMDSLKDRWETLPPYFITSSEKRIGREEVLAYIEEINKQINGTDTLS